MSIAEGLNENLEEQDPEKTQDAFPTAQHTPDNRRTKILPGRITCSKWIEKNAITYKGVGQGVGTKKSYREGSSIQVADIVGKKKEDQWKTEKEIQYNGRPTFLNSKCCHC